MTSTSAGLQRSFATGLQINLGLFSVTADAVPVRRVNSKAEVALVSICPECEVPNRVTTRYVCDNGHGPFFPGEIKKARETEETLVPISAEEVAQIAGDYFTGSMDLKVCAREELEANTRPAENAYRLRLPKKGRASDHYALLLEMAKHPTLALYGVMKVNARTSPTPFVVQEWGGQLVLQSLIRPQDLAERDEFVEAPAEKLITMGYSLMEQSAAAFEADHLADARIDRLAAVLAGKGVGVAPEISVAAPAQDLLGLLEAALAAA